jgi:hypothetical protein
MCHELLSKVTLFEMGTCPAPYGGRTRLYLLVKELRVLTIICLHGLPLAFLATCAWIWALCSSITLMTARSCFFASSRRPSLLASVSQHLSNLLSAIMSLSCHGPSDFIFVHHLLSDLLHTPSSKRV